VPIQIASFTGREQKATVEYQGDTAEILFLPNLLTPNRIKHVQANAEDIEVLARTLSEVVTEWDVIGDAPVVEDLIAESIAEGAEQAQIGDGVIPQQVWTNPAIAANHPAPQPGLAAFTVVGRRRGPQGMYPLAPEALIFLPIGFLSAVMNAMFEAISPKSTRKGKN
jgi:hypothetical protein